MTWRRESPDVQWFQPEDYSCDRCGKRAHGILKGRRNESFGRHCERCAQKRINDAKKLREHEAAAKGTE